MTWRRNRFYVLRLRRLEGNVLDYKKITKHVIYERCQQVLTGLPQWARKLQKQRELCEKTMDPDDDYDKLLTGEGWGF